MFILDSYYIFNKYCNFSNSHSKKIFTDIFWTKYGKKAVDVEYMSNRSSNLYKFFFKKYNIKRNKNLELKIDFYENWLKYEIGIKIGKKNWKNIKVNFIEYNNYLIGFNNYYYKKHIININNILNFLY